MKILKIVDSRDGGGVVTCETQFIKELRSRGVIVNLVIVGRGRQLDRYRALGDNSFVLPQFEAIYDGNFLNKIKSIILSFWYAKYHSHAVLKELTDKYDALIFRRPYFIFLGGILSDKLSCAAYWHLPGIVNAGLAKKFYKMVCEKYNISPIANSEYTKKNLGEICKYVVYPGFDESRVQRSAPFYRDELGIAESSAVFGMVARVCHEKAQDLLVQGFISSKAIQMDSHLLIAGTSDETEFIVKLKELAGRYLDVNVHFIGHIEKLPEFYSSIDIAINSRRNAEAFGISVAEALGAGRPVMAYYLGGPSEMIDEDISGWLVKTSTSDAYCQAFNQSLEARKRWEQMGAESKRKSDKFSVKTNVDKLLNIIGSTAFPS